MKLIDSRVRKLIYALLILFAPALVQAAAVRSLQRDTLILGSSETTASVTIDAVDPARSILFVNASCNNGHPYTYLIGSELSSATTVAFHRRSSGAAAEIAWKVIEFAEGVTVQRGYADMAGATLDQTINAVDPDRSFALAYIMGPSGSSDLSRDDFVIADITSSTNLQLRNDDSDPNIRVYWQVIEYDDCSVQKLDVSMFANTTDTTYAITGVTPAKTMLVGNFYSTAINAYETQFWPLYQLTNATTVSVSRNASSYAINLLLYAVEFTDQTTVQHGSESFSSGTTRKKVTGLAAIDTSVSAAIAGGNYNSWGKSNSNDDIMSYGAFWFKLLGADSMRIFREWSGTQTGELSYQILTFENRVKTWNGTSANGRWSVAENWMPQSVPGASDSVVFDATSTANCTLDVSVSTGALSFAAGYSGALHLNGAKLECTSLATAGGSIHVGSDTLRVAGDADFSGLSSLNAGAGTVEIKADGGLTAIFSHGGHAYNDLVLHAHASSQDAYLDVTGGATLDINGDLTFRHYHSHIPYFRFDTGDPDVNVVVDGNVAVQDIGGGGGTVRTELGNGTWTVYGNIVLTNGYHDNSSATIVCAGADGVHTVYFGANGPHVRKTGGDIIQLAASSNWESFSLTAGGMDFNGHDLSTDGDFAVINGTKSTFVNLEGTTVSVGGNCTVTGSGCENLLWISGAAGSPATFNVTGAVTAEYDSIAYCLVSQPAAAANSKDGGNNTNWTINPCIPCTEPDIQSSPTAQNATAGDAVTFSVDAGGTEPFSYQWERNDGGSWSSISEATSSSYSLSSVSSADDGAQFRCVVSNACGAATSAAAALGVCTPPAIETAPSNANATAGESAVFTVVASGSALEYQWERNDAGAWAPIAGETGASYTVATVVAGDDGAQFRCVVSNACGAATSAAAMLNVCAPAAAAVQPVDANVIAGESATYTITASGTPEITYQWERKNAGAWETISGDSGATLTLNTVSLAQSGSLFRAIVQNSCGADTSAEVSLTVTAACDPAYITDQPVDTAAIPGRPVSFTVSAGGSSPAYQWQQYVTAWTDVSDEGSPALAVSSVTLADNGLRYRCIVTNECGSDTSDAAVLHVACDTITIQPHPADVAVDEGAEATFTISATGNELTYQWQRSPDGQSWSDIADATAADLTVQAALEYDQSRYRCAIIDACGADTVTDAAVLTVNNTEPPAATTSLTVNATGPRGALARWQTPESSSDDADSVFLLYATDGYPAFDDASAVRLGMPVTEADSSRDAIIGGLDAEQDYWFTLWIVDIAGNRTQADSATAQTPAFGSVFNPVTLSADTVSATEIKLHIGGFSEAPTFDSAAYADTIGVWYATDDYPSEPDTATVGWKIALSDAIALGDPFDTVLTVPAATDSFYYFAGSLYWRQTATGDSVARFGDQNRAFVLMIDTTAVRPANSIVLTATAQSPTEVNLEWSEPDSVRIWYATSPIDTGKDLSSSQLSGITPAGADTAVTVDGLAPITTYWFGLERFSGGAWSYVSQTALDSVTTPEIDTGSIVENRLRIDSLAYDTVHNEIVVSVKLDTANGFWHDDLEVGLSYRISQAPVVDTGLQAFELSGLDTVASLDIETDLYFDSLYYVVARLRRKGSGVWSPVTDEATDSIRTPAFTWQRVRYWPADDSVVTAANRRIVIKKSEQSDASGTTADSLAARNLPADANGFVEVGQGFTFTRKLPTAPFYVGIRIDSAHLNLADKSNLYRDSAGILLVEHNSFVESDVIWVLTNELRHPFYALADTVAPTAAIPAETDTAAVAEAGQSIETRFTVSDNVGNAIVRFEYGAGNGDYTDSLVRILHGNHDTLDAAIGASSVNPNFGVRARIIVDDGVYRDTIDVSRRVAIEQADEIPAAGERQWTPLRTTARLDNPSPWTVLSDFLDKDDPNDGYDNTAMRLFRWYPHAGNRKKNDKWVEFSSDADSLFEFKPGRVFWIKTATRPTVYTGSGVSISLKQPAHITLPAGQWTDFSSPFKFDIMLGDLFDATGPEADSLHLYHWVATDSGYTAQEVYISGIAETESARTEGRLIYGVQRDAYTVYNPLDNPVVLHIPPTPVKLSTYTTSSRAKRTAQTGHSGWSVRVLSSSAVHGSLGSVYCGVSARAGFFPKAPSFSRANVGVLDTASGAIHGHRMIAELDRGNVFTLVYYNDGLRADTILSTIRGDAHPADMMIRAFSPAKGAWFADDSYTVALEPGERSSVWLAAGDESYLAELAETYAAQRLSLVNCYADRHSRGVRVLFTAPPDGSTVRCSLFDLRGRLIRRRNFSPASVTGGVQTVTIGENAAPGLYVLRLESTLRGTVTKSLSSTVMIP